MTASGVLPVRTCPIDQSNRAFDVHWKLVGWEESNIYSISIPKSPFYKPWLQEWSKSVLTALEFLLFHLLCHSVSSGKAHISSNNIVDVPQYMISNKWNITEQTKDKWMVNDAYKTYKLEKKYRELQCLKN